MKTLQALTLSAIVVMAVGPAAAQTGDTAAMITEIKPGRGRIEVRPAGTGEWKPARPLLALRPGDTLRASEDATAVLLFAGGRGTTRVDRASSPFTVAGAAADEGKVQKARELLQASLGYLAGGTRETSRAVLATRSAAQPPVILAPRNSRVLPGPLVFEWHGARFSRYTVRILGPDRSQVIGPREVTGARWEFPADASPLRPGIRYTLRVEAGGQAPQEAWFELLDPGRAEAIRADLGALAQALPPGTPPSSADLIRAAYLASLGLTHDARLIVVAALTRDPDEPALHLLLGDLHSRVGLTAQAAQSYEEADFLMNR